MMDAPLTLVVIFNSTEALFCLLTNVSIFIFHIGAASKRFGIDGDREAVPLKLEVVYNRVRCCLILFSIKIGILKLQFCKNCLISTVFYQHKKIPIPLWLECKLLLFFYW